MKNFLKTSLASALGVILAAGVCFSILLASLSGSEESLIEEGSILVLNLATPIAERDVSPSLQERIQGAQTPLQRHLVLEAISQAAKDELISGLFLYGDGASNGWVINTDLQKALLEFKKQGKTIWAWAPGYDEADYLLASTADHLWIGPFGSITINGLYSSREYLRDFLDRFGVGVQVTRVGKYKSAIEPMMLSQMSPENREQISSYLGDLFANFQRDTAAARGFEVGRLESLANASGHLLANQAKEQGFVDDILYWDQVLKELQEHAPGEDTFLQATLDQYIAQLNPQPNSENTAPEIGVVFAEGDIVDGSGDSGVFGDTIALALRKLRLDDSISAVVLRVNSPGGSAGASETILREVALLKEAGKPVVSSMGNVAASGGYWISSLANKILVQPSTITGSIGVFGMMPEFSRLIEDFDINIETVKTHPYADMMAMTRARTNEELDVIQQSVDEIYDAFLDRVAEGRGMEREAVHEIAQGRVWSGSKAVELGLADGFGDLHDAIELAAEIADLEEYAVRYPSKDEDAFADALAALLDDQHSQELAKLQTWFPSFLKIPTLGAENGIYARMPFGMESH